MSTVSSLVRLGGVLSFPPTSLDPVCGASVTEVDAAPQSHVSTQLPFSENVLMPASNLVALHELSAARERWNDGCSLSAPHGYVILCECPSCRRRNQNCCKTIRDRPRVRRLRRSNILPQQIAARARPLLSSLPEFLVYLNM